MIGNVLYHFSKELHVCRIFPVFYPGADKVTEDSAEILVSGVGEEASRIGQHADEVGEKPQVCKRGHLLGHSGFIVVEPPGGAVLDFSDSRGILEAADNRTDSSIVNRI